MTFLRLIRSELLRLTSNIIPIITVMGLALIPLLYAGVYLYANWNPENNLDSVDAALVNTDQPADFDGETRTIGDDVAEELLDDAAFAWHPVDSVEAAAEGVEDGTYQFAFVIPADFSEALASPSSFEHAEQATLEILTNDANNYLVSDIARALADQVHTSVAEEVGEETADAMLTGFGRIHHQLVDAAEGATELYDNAGNLSSGLAELNDGAAELREGIGEAHNATGQLGDGAGRLTSGAGELSSGASELESGAGELASGLSTLESGAGGLERGASEVSSGAAQVEENLLALSSGASEVAAGNASVAGASRAAGEVIGELSVEAENYADDAVVALVEAGMIEHDDADAAYSAVVSATSGSEALDRADSVREDLTATQASLDELAAGSQQVADGTSELAAGSTTLRQGAEDVAAGALALTEGLSETRGGAGALAEGASELSFGASELESGAGELDEGITALNDGTAELYSGAGELHDGLSQASQGSIELTEGAGELSAHLHSGSQDVPNPDSETQEELAQVMGNPVAVSETSHAEAGSYGAGMAPFFMALSLWIGALVMLQVLRPVSPRALASNAHPAAVAAGSWIPFMLLSMVQTLLLYAAVVLGLGLSPAHPWLTLGVLFLASTGFTALIHAVVLLLGNPGKMVALVLLVLQLVASGGTFPYQSLPEPLQALHPVMPMSYVIDALRQSIYGGGTGTSLKVVAAMGVTAAIGFLVLVLAVRKHRMWSVKTLQPAISEAA